jgi:predicted phage terminase large subunit-like protein
MRLTAQAAHFHAGVVHFPEDAPWLDELMTELLGFPGVRDDQVDSISQALAFIRAGANPIAAAASRCRFDDHRIKL